MVDKRRTVDRVILAVLILGAAVFLLGLAGVGSEILMRPVHYRPSAPPTRAAVGTGQCGLRTCLNPTR